MTDVIAIVLGLISAVLGVYIWVGVGPALVVLGIGLIAIGVLLALGAIYGFLPGSESSQSSDDEADV